MSFGARLKERREALGITQPQLAEMLKVSKGAIGNWETDVNSPRATLLYSLFDILQCDANYLFQDEMKSNFPMKVSYDEMEHIKKYRALDADGQFHVGTVLEWETSRVTALSELKRRQTTVIELQSQHSTSCLTEYFRSASAGDGVFILGNEAASKISISGTDWDPRVDYVIKVSGDSMEPDFVDGDNVMVSQRVEMRHGDVGIFIVNGKAYIKEYGKTELISRNPDADNIKIAEYDNIVCMGKVIGKLHEPYEVIKD